MKLIFLSTMTFICMSVLQITRLDAQQIVVGKVSDGITKLDLDDATLTTTFSFILKGATLSDARLTSATDNEGLFYYIAANGQRSGQSSLRIAIILNEIEGGVLAFIGGSGGGCEMECNAGLPCTACEQNIIVRCKSQKCTCTAGMGGCNSRITFPD
jgi:hypothetical protein